MAVYGAFQAHAVDHLQRIIPAAMVEVIDEDTGNAAVIYSTRAGAALANPFEAGQDGYFRFYAPGGRYRINVYKNGQVSTPWRDVPIGTAAEYDYFGLSTRETLAANRTYYVRTDGSDLNNGLANDSGGAFASLNAARDAVAALDLNGFSVTIQVGDGTYTAGLVWLGSKMPIGGGVVTIQGNSGTPANVLISVTSTNAINISGAPKSLTFVVKDMELRTTTGGSCLLVRNGTILQWSNIKFGACASSHVDAHTGANLTCAGNYEISGGAVQHLLSRDPGTVITENSRTVTLTGTPAFSSVYANAFGLSYIEIAGNTFSGSATGARYSAILNSIINTGGGGASHLPGNSAGATATGGQYL